MQPGENQSGIRQQNYKNPLEDQLNYKNYYRMTIAFFILFVIFGIIQTYQFTSNSREHPLSFL